MICCKNVVEVASLFYKFTIVKWSNILRQVFPGVTRTTSLKAAFVLAENGFGKTIYTLPCVWLHMENMVKRKIISVDCKIPTPHP